MPSTSNHPLVVIRVPAYNHEAYVVRCLDSIATDDYPNKLVVVTDDCSTDRTPELAEKACQQHGFIFRRNAKNIGVCATLNSMTAGFMEADYFFSIASDDELVPGALKQLVSYLQANPATGAAYARVRIIKPNGLDLGEMRNAAVSGMIFERVVLGEAGIPSQWMLWRRAVYEQVGLYDVGTPLEDKSFFNKAARRFPIDFVDCTWVRYRQHPTNSTQATWRMYVAAKALTDTYRGEPFYDALLKVESLNWWMLLAQKYPREAGRYFGGAVRRWRDRRFWAGLLYFLRLGFIVNMIRRR